MSGGVACTCPRGWSTGDRRRHWVVTAYHVNHSAFSGGRATPSAYSEVSCSRCGSRWRTRAAYVERLPVKNAPVPAPRGGRQDPRAAGWLDR